MVAPGVETIKITSREQWLALRALYVTASDVPAVCGDGMFGSPARVWASKRGMIPMQEENAAMQRGRWGEAAVFEAMAELHPHLEIRRAKVFLRDAARRMGCTPDGVAIDPNRDGLGILQCKVVAAPVFRAKWLADEGDDPHDLDAAATAPLAYQLQTITESMLAAADWAALAVLVIDTFRWTLRMFDVPRHEVAEARILDRVAHFWSAYLDPGIQPPIDPEMDSELVKQLWPRDDGTTIDLSGHNQIMELVDRRDALGATIKVDEAAKKEADTAIKAIIGDHTYGEMPDGRTISYKLQHRKGFEVAPTSFRVLRVSRAKGVF